MTVRILASVAGTIAAPLIGGLAYRKVRQRRVAKALMIGRPAPELTNLCATPAGTTTTWPPVASITSSPAVKVALPSCTTKTSS
jgi:hypothetical protein